MGRGEWGGIRKEGQGSTIHPHHLSPGAFTPGSVVGHRPPPTGSSMGRTRQQVQKKLLPVEAVFVEGAPLPTLRLKVTRRVWENQGAPSPASLGQLLPCWSC